jgi:hypothetical protein
VRENVTILRQLQNARFQASAMIQMKSLVFWLITTTNHLHKSLYKPHPTDTWYFSMTIDPMKLGPVGCPKTLAPYYFPKLRAWKTIDFSFSMLKSYVGSTVKGIQEHKPSLFFTQFSLPFVSSEYCDTAVQ